MGDAGGGRTPDEADVVAELKSFDTSQSPIETTLRTDARVIARVTDGIYRQPGSALRELISNAYDADATQVTILTDRPRFDRIVIEDDGHGMSPEALVRLLYHIGGSSKRTAIGAELGVTSENDSTRSPRGRPLIGKIGIGLFSVAQLTREFQIITKVEGDDHRTIASVNLRQYADSSVLSADGEDEYEAGKVLIWRERAKDHESHGTTVVLDAVRPQTRETLRSVAMWEAISASDIASERDRPKPPKFHIGTVQRADDSLLKDDAESRLSVPWNSSDVPRVAFSKLVSAVWGLVDTGTPNPAIEKIFDYYLQMVWDLSLWVPLPYIDRHPFDLTGSSGLSTYKISGGQRERLLALGETQSVRDAGGLGNEVTSPPGFSVQIDDLELSRPIKFEGLPSRNSAVKSPILFVASESQSFAGVDFEISGGSLAFQAYLLWAPKIAPVDHSGVMVRVHDASGIRFDPEFFRFPVAEQRRMAQISCEIFITQGFDGALNIDRESFNVVHPHAVVVTKWLHSALRRLIAVQKKVAADTFQSRRAAAAKSTTEVADKIVERAWSSKNDNDGTEPPVIVFTDSRELPAPASGAGSSTSSGSAYVLDRSRVIGDVSGANKKQRQELLESEIGQIAQVLAAYGLLDRLSPAEQDGLLEAIREILQAYE